MKLMCRVFINLNVYTHMDCIYSSLHKLCWLAYLFPFTKGTNINNKKKWRLKFLWGSKNNKLKNTECLPLLKGNEITRGKTKEETKTNCDNWLFQNFGNYPEACSNQGEFIQEKCLDLGKNRVCIILT